jgi:nucleoside-diphosphate-sugar epimerase
MRIWNEIVPASLSNTTVLLTGANGFTGRYVHRALEDAGAHVVVLDADLRNRDAIIAQLESHTIDYVIHLAAISFVPHGSDLDIYAINLFGTQNLLEALSQTQKFLKKVVLASSANVYGNTKVPYIDESQCPAPVNHYGFSKLSMEHMAALYRDRFELLITRPFNYTGHGQAEHFLVPKIISHFQRRAECIELGNIDVSRDFSDVRWIAQAYCALLLSPKQGTFNLCSSRAVSLRHIIESLELLSSHTLRIEINPAFVRSNEIEILQGSNTSLYAALPELIKPIPIEETLAWMLSKGTV